MKYCEENEIDAYIPNFGRYKPEREGFIYNKELDQYECQQGNKAVLTLQNANIKNGAYTGSGIQAVKKNAQTAPSLNNAAGRTQNIKS